MSGIRFRDITRAEKETNLRYVKSCEKIQSVRVGPGTETATRQRGISKPHRQVCKHSSLSLKPFFIISLTDLLKHNSGNHSSFILFNKTANKKTAEQDLKR